jgi:hypothetical protein
MKKNLVYFMYLKDGVIGKFAEVNLKLLNNYLSIFDGQKIIKIAVDDVEKDTSLLTDIFSEVTDCTVEIVKNDPEKADGETFINALKQLRKEPSLTFYSHAKGASIDYGEEKFQVHKLWMFSMYFYNLEPEFVTEIEYQLQNGKSFSGILRKEINCAPWVVTDWHYSGTFYWFNTLDILNTDNWDALETNRFTAEAFPGHIVPLEKSHYNLVSLPYNFDTYHHNFWESLIKPDVMGVEIYNKFINTYNKFIE